MPILQEGAYVEIPEKGVTQSSTVDAPSFFFLHYLGLMQGTPLLIPN